MKSSFRVARIAGIDIGVHYSWILAFVLIAWSLAEGFFPTYYSGWSTATYWGAGVASAFLLFVAVVLHELAHSLVAKAQGMNVKSITLFILGGVSNLEGEPERAMVEFRMAIVGPLTSLILGGIFWGVLQGISDRTTPVAAIVGYLALINLLLGAFNLIPAFPLDGGRVLRSILWGEMKSVTRATNVAASVGRFFGWAMIAYGLFALLTGNFLQGIWIAFIGWFLSSAAEASRQEVTLREHLKGIAVKDLMDPTPDTIGPETTVQEVVQRIFQQRRRRAVPVVQNSQLLGIVTLADVKELPMQQWSSTPVSKIMTKEPLCGATPDEDLSTAMREMAQRDLNQLVVCQQGHLAGLLSRADIIHHLNVKQELGIGAGSGDRRGDGGRPGSP